jgi:endonuclease/exonuclease/phosphatase family metal-dependent hydrolase
MGLPGRAPRRIACYVRFMHGAGPAFPGPRTALRWTVILLSLGTVVGVRSAGAAEPRGAEFSVLTYNVAGLPALLSASRPESHAPVIGELLNLYDIALLQEDFTYHRALETRARHPHRSRPLTPGRTMLLGDGLNRFSATPFQRFARVAWRACHGRFSNGGDCLTKKGFTVAEHRLAEGVRIDVYNVHMDAGGSAGDRAARARQVDQLLAALETRSADQAVIVAGDTNMDAQDEPLLDHLLAAAGLEDACRNLGCRTPRMIDRVLFRGSEQVRLEAVHMDIDPRFVAEDGQDLSDHKAVGVVLRWSLTGPKLARVAAPSG